MFGPDGGGTAEEELTFVRFSENAPALESTEVSFWAVRGQDREVQMRWVGGGKCVRLRVPAEALWRNPNGRAFAEGDSIRITITLSGEQRYQFTFEPSGLRFNPAHPAELEIRYRWADPDYNGDGVVDASDLEMLSELRIWHQASPRARWTPIPTDRYGQSIEAQASVLRFSQYALAVD